jgi:hypothetical protein
MQVKRVFVTPELITTMLTTGYVLNSQLTITEGLPQGATLTAVGWDVSRRAWALDFQSPAFPEVQWGAEPPVLDVLITKKASVLVDALSE